jgi:hypothetical protein
MKTITGALVALVLFATPAQAPSGNPANMPADEGPRCTVIYPRGFTVPKGTKKRPLSICTHGDLESTWRGCELRYSI